MSASPPSASTTSWATLQLPGALLTLTLVVLSVVGVLALRLDQLAGDAGLSLPVVAAQTCMLLMALVPLMLGGGALLGVRRLLGTRRDD